MLRRQALTIGRITVNCRVFFLPPNPHTHLVVYEYCVSVFCVKIQAVGSHPCDLPQAMDPERVKRREEIQRAMSFIQ